jgi:hypothetical protein
MQSYSWDRTLASAGYWRLLVKLLNCCHNIRISAASAQVSAHPISDLAFAIRMSFRQASRRGAELSSGAKAALESVVPDKRVLQSTELTILSKSFDGDDFVSFVHHR